MSHKKYFISLLYLGAVMIVLLGCSGRTSYRVTSADVPPVTIARFDSLLVQYMQQSDTSLVMQDAFWGVYNRHILGLYDAPYYREGLNAFFTDSLIALLYADTQREYADMSAEQQQLTALVGRYHTLFPDRPLPVVQTHISGLNQSIVTMDSLLSLSIDTYLGHDYPLYKQRYNDYELLAHDRNRILPDVAEVLLRNALPKQAQESLLDAMIYEGRLLVLMSGLLATNDATLLLGYSPAEAEWCAQHEEWVWNTIVERQHLFAADRIMIRKYIHPAPFATPLSQEAPGRIGRWVGWRIVSKYMKEQGVTPLELAVDTTSATDILRGSHYNGK